MTPWSSRHQCLQKFGSLSDVRRCLSRSQAAAFFGAAVNTDRRRRQNAVRQARWRARHRGETRALQLPCALHAVIRRRARTAGLSVSKFLQIRLGIQP